jgi:hypothetical protein
MAGQPSLKRYRIKFDDVYGRDLYFQFEARNRSNTINIMKDILSNDGYVPNNHSKIVSFIEEKT